LFSCLATVILQKLIWVKMETYKEYISNAVDQLTKGLGEMFEIYLNKAIEKIMTETRSRLNPQEKIDDEYLDVFGAVELTKYSKHTIYKYVSENRIPHFKINRKLVFLKKELTEWINDSRKKTVLELNEDVKNYQRKRKGV